MAGWHAGQGVLRCHGGPHQGRHMQLPGSISSQRWSRMDKCPLHPDWRNRRSRQAIWWDSLSDSKRMLHFQTAALDAQPRGRLGMAQASSCVVERLCQEGELDKALAAVFRMEEEGTPTSVSMYKSLLKACEERRALAQAKRLHAHLTKHGLESTCFLGEYVVSTLVKCGGLEFALQVFHTLPNRSVFSWTALISGHVTSRNCREAIKIYQCMRQEGVHPDAYTLVSLLKACASLADLKVGRRIHREAVEFKCETNLFVANCLINMYGKCGSILDAENVFNTMQKRDVVSWNALLAAYAQQGQAHDALLLYERMQKEGVRANTRTLVSTLQACSMLAEKEGKFLLNGQSLKVECLGMGKSIHADAQKQGYTNDAFVVNTLICMYGKCGCIVDAWNVFDGFSKQDLVSWNGILTAYLEVYNGEKALQLYARMREEGISPDSWIFVTVLQACCMLGEEEENVVVNGRLTKYNYIVRGKVIHADAWSRGYESDVFVGSSLLSMYAKSESIPDAQRVFERLSEHSVVAWTAMLFAYVAHGQAEKAWCLYVQMCERCDSPNDRTFIGALQACSMLAEKEEDVFVDGRSTKIECLRRGKSIHAAACRSGYASDVILGSTLVSMYGKCGSIVDAEYVFDGLAQRDVTAWTVMLVTYVQQGEPEKALLLYEQMRENEVSPDVQTMACTAQACGMLAEREEFTFVDGGWTKVKSLEIAREIHAHADEIGCHLDVFVGSTLVSMYGKCRSVVEAQRVFYSLSKRNLVSWNSMLAAYVEQGEAEKALHLYSLMEQENVSPDDITFLCLLRACSDTGSLSTLKRMHSTMVSTRCNLSPSLASALITAYGGCASMVDAQHVFDAASHPDLVLWTALIAAYARQGTYSASLQCYKKMLLTGIKPDEVTFLSVLSACSHAGLVEKGVEYFESMSRDHGLTPGMEHYVCMVDLLGRAGWFTRVEELLEMMPMQPNLDVLLCLLGACQKQGQLVLAEEAFKCAVDLEPQHPAAYVIMSNIYAEAGLTGLAKQVQKLRRKEGAWKQAGLTWIDHGEKVQVFLAGDGRCKVKQPSELLQVVKSRMEEERHILLSK